MPDVIKYAVFFFFEGSPKACINANAENHTFRYLSLQLLERFGNGALSISEVEVYGWGRTCNDDV